MVWLPRVRDDVLKDATPLLFNGTWASTVLPSAKVTWPVGVPVPGGVAATVAVKETDWPGVDGLGEEAIVVFDAEEWMNWTSDELPALKFASPL